MFSDLYLSLLILLCIFFRICSVAETRLLAALVSGVNAYQHDSTLTNVTAGKVNVLRSVTISCPPYTVQNDTLLVKSFGDISIGEWSNNQFGWRRSGCIMDIHSWNEKQPRCPPGR